MAENVLVNASSTKYDNSSAEKKTKVVVVLGAQFGDEGKGRISDLLSQHADVVCRCQVCVYSPIPMSYVTNMAGAQWWGNAKQSWGTKQPK